jgi:hypothetical protein
MALSSLKDPIDLARAQGALELTWRTLQAEGLVMSPATDRARLSLIIVNLVGLAIDEDDLAKRAVDKFKKSDEHRR